VDGGGFQSGFSARVRVGSQVFPLNPGAQTIFISSNRVQVIVKIGDTNSPTTQFSLWIVNPDNQSSNEFTGLTAQGRTASLRIDSINPNQVTVNSPTWLTVRGASFRPDFRAEVSTTSGTSPIDSANKAFDSSSQVRVQVLMRTPPQLPY